jgi:universal stress protein E
MEKLSSILVVANRNEADWSLLAKAVLLARGIRARIHLFACNAEHAYVLRHAYDSRGVDNARRSSAAECCAYLETLRASVRPADVEIFVDAACDSPLYSAIVQKALAIRADLVMKSPAGAHPLCRFTLDPNDWQLMRACPATLMLVRGRSWAPQPRFAAMVDISDQEIPQLAEAIVHTSEYFSLACDGSLDVIYGDRGNSSEPARATLSDLAHEYRIDPAHVHTVGGDPDVTLPEFAAQRDYDALALGALTHRKGLAALVGTLTARLVDALECDFILVKPETGDRTSEERADPLVTGGRERPVAGSQHVDPRVG